MALKVEVEFSRVRDVAVHDRTRRTVPAGVGFLGVSGEETDVVALANDQHGDLGLYTEGHACG